MNEGGDAERDRAETADALARRLRAVLDAHRLVAWEWAVPQDRVQRDRGEQFGPAPTDLTSFLSYVCEEDRAQVERAVRTSIERGTPYHVVYRKHVGDELRWFEATADVERDESGRVARFVGATADITMRRKLEEQLHQAQKMEAVGRLAGGVAHDFNNLLTAIVACTELLRAHLARDPVALNDLDEIVSATTRATALTRRLLDLSRRQPLHSVVLDVNELVGEMQRLAARVIGEDIELSCELSEEQLTVRADPGQIQQILLNLLMNARDATASGGRVTVVTGQLVLAPSNALLLPAGRYVRIDVMDNGVGMDEATRQRAFEPFFTTKPAGRGTGLGLAMVHAIAKQLGGIVTVESFVGKSTTFSVFLPLLDAPPDPIRVPPAQPPRSHTAATILLVEDDPSVRRVARRTLETAGHVVIEAADGELGVEAFEANASRIDLVLTDVVMPRLSGPRLAERIREKAPEVPIVFTSGWADDDMLQHGVQAGEVAFVRKPYTPEALLDVVTKERRRPS